MNTLKRDARRLVQALDDLGFNADDSINGGDTVDVIANYMPVLNKLPALVELHEAVGKFLKLGAIHQENYDALIAAFDKVKP
jgi:hypothetical protein